MKYTKLLEPGSIGKVRTRNRIYKSGAGMMTFDQDEISMNEKGDIKNAKYVWYKFSNGKYMEDPSLQECRRAGFRRASPRASTRWPSG